MPKPTLKVISRTFPAQFWMQVKVVIRSLLFDKFAKSDFLKLALSILSILLGTALASAQKDTVFHRVDTLSDRFYLLQNVERNGEKLPEIEIKDVTILGKRKLFEGFQYWRYERLVYNVKKTYPYALIVREKFKEVNATLQKMPDDKTRKDYLKDIEKQVFHDYEADMREMTISQGKILIRLIDRETNITSYDLIKQYRGKISASFWQGIARIFGTNLKEAYDPYGDDLLIENIISEIDAGRL